MKRLCLLGILLLLPLVGQAQHYVKCDPARVTPCTTDISSNTNSGDPAWYAFGEFNTNFQYLSPLFNAPSGTIIGNNSGSPGTISALSILPFTLTVPGGGTGAISLSGPIKGNGSSPFTAAAAADIFGLWSGTCSSSTFLRGDGACASPSGSGTVTTTGSPASGNLAAFSGASSITYTDLSGDVTTTGTLVTTVGKIGGVAVGTFATQNYATPPAIGGTTPAAGSFTTLYAGSTLSGAGFTTYFASPPAIGSVAAGTGAFTTLSASSTVSGTGFSSYLASPPAIGGTTAAAGTFTTLKGTTLNGNTFTTGTYTLTGTAGKTLDFTNSLTLSGTDGTTMTFPGTTGTVDVLNNAQTVTAVKTFTNSDLCLLGSSTGCTTFTSANASSSAYTLTIPAATGTLALLGANQTFTGSDTFTAESTFSSTANANLPVSIINTDSTATNFPLLFRALAPNLNTGNSVSTDLGVAFSTNNLGSLVFNYVGAGSASNTISLHLFNGSDGIKIDGAGDVFAPAVTTGTNTAFACFASGEKFTLQTSSCTISSLRFKIQVADWLPTERGLRTGALDELVQMRVATFQMKPGEKPNPDPNFGTTQIGLIAEDIAKIEPRCAIYENDMKTPKSYRQECVIAMLVKGIQEEQQEIDYLKSKLPSDQIILAERY